MSFLITLLVWSSPARADAQINQANAMAEVAKLNRQAVTDSLQSSMLNAMRSYTNVLQAQPSGAYSNAMKSVSQYTNAERLETLKFLNEKLETSLNSDRGGKTVEQSLVGIPLPNVSYRQLDPAFLHKGEGKAVAEKFEEASGLKREQFFQHISELSEQKSFGGLTVSAMKLAKSQLATFVKNLGGAKAGEVLGFLEPISPAEGVKIMIAEIKKAGAGQAVAASSLQPSPPKSVIPAREPTSVVAVAFAPGKSVAAGAARPSPFKASLADGLSKSEELAVNSIRQDQEIFQLVGTAVDGETIFRRVREKYRELQRDRL